MRRRCLTHVLLLLLCEGGMERLQNFWLSGVCRKDSDSKGDISLPLEILNFTSAFILLASGMVLAGLLLICEHIYFKCLRANLRKWDQRGCCSLISLVGLLVIVPLAVGL